MEATTRSASPGKASQACRPCRRLKRKCNRELPSCALCIRLSKPCGYPIKRDQEPADDTDYLLQRIQQLECQLEQVQSSCATGSVAVGAPVPAYQVCFPFEDTSHCFEDVHCQPIAADGTTPFPKALILDPDVFAPLSRGSVMHDTTGKTPCRILEAIGLEKAAILEAYFSGLHHSFPILSRKRTKHAMENSPTLFNPSIASLLLCMKLLTEPLQSASVPETPLYRLTKQYAESIESAGAITLALVQCLLLISIYELGHAIHPAAYVSIGRAARLGHLLGLHDRDHATQMFKEPNTWTLCEEERRTWWAVIVLDRYVHCGMSRVPLATSEPLQGELLPCNDIEWNQGFIGSNDPLFTPNPSYAIPGIHFACICRASHILGRVLRHRDDRLLEFPDKLTEAFQLHRALLALEASFTYEATPAQVKQCDLPRAFVCSALFILYNIYACNERYDYYKLGQETDMQKTSLEGLSTVTFTVARIAQRVKEDWNAGLKGHAPMLAHCMYQALGECAWFVREDPDLQMKYAFDTIVDALKCMSQEWRVCDEYLKLFESSEGLIIER